MTLRFTHPSDIFCVPLLGTLLGSGGGGTNRVNTSMVPALEELSI